MCIRIPLRRRDGTVRAYAVVDEIDAHLAEHRWCLDGVGYATRHLSRAVGHPGVWLHRVILGLSPGDGLEADHVNGDRLDNRRANLRVVTHAQNMQNVAAVGGTSPHRGVSWDKRRGKWKAYGRQGNDRIDIGRFDQEEDAADAARAWRVEHLPFTNETRAVAGRGC